MVPEHRGEREDPGRLEAARRALRGLGGAFKAARLYSSGHSLSRQALQNAVTALQAYLTSFGALGMAIIPRGVAFDFQPRPYEDEVIAELVRALRAGSVRELRILPGTTAEEVGELLQVLYLPQQHLTRGGGVSILLRERGVNNLVVDDFGAESPSAEAAASLVRPLLDAIAAGAQAVSAQLVAQSGGDPEAAVRAVRGLDRALAVRPHAEQQAARATVGRALAERTPFHLAVRRAMVQALDEPWAVSLAVHWPPDPELTIEDPRAAALLASHRGPAPPAEPWPPVAAVTAAELRRARDELAIRDAPQRMHAMRRLLQVMPAMAPRRFEECLAVIERNMVLAEEDNPAPVVTVLSGLNALSRWLPDGRAELAHVALHRIMALRVRDLLAGVLAQPLAPDHPFYLAMQEAPDETVVLLLEMMADEERLRVRREIVSLLQAFAADRVHLLAGHVVDPRWYIARNVVTVLGGTGRPEVVPYLRAGLAHDDVRVRKETLQALAQIRTPQAVEVMSGALSAGDLETREAAAHWLGMTGLPDAVPPLIAVLESEPLYEAVEVKREAIRSLGRLATPDARAALARVQTSGGLLGRRQIDELRQEAALALAALREAKP